MAASRVERVPAVVERALDAALDKALEVQRPVVLAYLVRSRARRPGCSPTELISALEHRYLATVVGIGAASGGAAGLPGVGTGTAVASGVLEIGAFVSATALYVLAVAEVHGVPVSDPQVRRALVLTVLLGEGATAALEGVQTEATHWAQWVASTVSRDRIASVNSRLRHLLMTRFGARQSALLLGRALPFGIGAGIGAVGNAALARGAITSARRAFGPAPTRFLPRVIDATVVGTATPRVENADGWPFSGR